jgi:aerobic-type carbon monoxide dehydrogenase small subunit (CoxS/CutS family)
MRVTLSVNGVRRDLELDPRRTLLETLRSDLGLTGAKLCCGVGNCGACTVLRDGRAVYACLLLAVDCDGSAVTTVEALARDGELHPVQQAFLDCDAVQCGYCTPGQVMSTLGLLAHQSDPSDAEIQTALAGNLCRCGAYRNIVRAARQAAARMREASADQS